MQDQMPAVSVAVNVAAHPHSRETANHATLATGSAGDLSPQLQQPLLVRVAACEEASKEALVRAVDSPQLGVRAKAPKALAGHVASSRKGRSSRERPLLLTPTTNGDQRCALTLLSSHPHPHPMLAYHHHRRPNLLRLLAAPV